MGFCGTDPVLYCGAGCQPLYGTCGGSSENPSATATSILPTSASQFPSPASSSLSIPLTTVAPETSTVPPTTASTTIPATTAATSTTSSKPTFSFTPNNAPSSALTDYKDNVGARMALSVVFMALLLI
ncbi:hypothetical protein BGZ83_000490 [Gryganskiella cystojenkinii]|nr:hypothetical protein BGZ83_000490 [Gryganskiella cystojenkinii]